MKFIVNFFSAVAIAVSCTSVTSSGRNLAEALLTDHDFLTFFFIDKTVGVQYGGEEIACVMEHFQRDDFTSSLFDLLIALYQKRCREYGHIINYAEACMEHDMEPACPVDAFLHKFDTLCMTSVYPNLPPGTLRKKMFESILISPDLRTIENIFQSVEKRTWLFERQLQIEIAHILSTKWFKPLVELFLYSIRWDKSAVFKRYPNSLIRLSKPSLLEPFRHTIMANNMLACILSNFIDQSDEVGGYFSDPKYLSVEELILVAKRYPLEVFKVETSSVLPPNVVQSLKCASFEAMMTTRYRKTSLKGLSLDGMLKDVHSVHMDHLGENIASWFVHDLLTEDAKISGLTSSFDIRALNTVSMHEYMAMELYPNVLKDFTHALSKSFMVNPLVTGPCNPNVFFEILSDYGRAVEPIIWFYRDIHPIMSDHRLSLVNAFMDLVKNSPLFPRKQVLLAVCAQGHWMMDYLEAATSAQGNGPSDPNHTQDYLIHSLIFGIGAFAGLDPTLRDILESAVWLYFPQRFLQLKGLTLGDALRVGKLFLVSFINKGWVLEHFMSIDDTEDPKRHVSSLLDPNLYLDEFIKFSKGARHDQVCRRIGQVARWCEASDEHHHIAVQLKAIFEDDVLFGNSVLAKVASLFMAKSPKSMFDGGLDKYTVNPHLYAAKSNLLSFMAGASQLFIPFLTPFQFGNVFPIMTFSEQLDYLRESKHELIDEKVKIIVKCLGPKTRMAVESMVQYAFRTSNPVVIVKNAIHLLDQFLIDIDGTQPDPKLLHNLVIILCKKVQFQYFVQFATKRVLICMLNCSFGVLSIHRATYIADYPIAKHVCSETDRREIAMALAVCLHQIRVPTVVLLELVKQRAGKFYVREERVMNCLVRHSQPAIVKYAPREYDYMALARSRKLQVITFHSRLTLALPDALSSFDLNLLAQALLPVLTTEAIEEDRRLYLLFDGQSNHIRWGDEKPIAEYGGLELEMLPAFAHKLDIIFYKVQ